MGRGLGGCLATVGGVSEGGRGIGMVGAGKGLRVCEGLGLGGDLLGELAVVRDGDCVVYWLVYSAKTKKL